MLDFSKAKLLTFDCYGTLIDWESGLFSALRPVLAAHAERCDQLGSLDQALTTELVMGVLRWRSALDDAIAEVSAQNLTRLDVEVLISLRLGVYQLGWLDRVPARAAINESVDLVKRARKRSAAPFANAVLRKLADHPERIHVRNFDLEGVSATSGELRIQRRPPARTGAQFVRGCISACREKIGIPESIRCGRREIKPFQTILDFRFEY